MDDEQKTTVELTDPRALRALAHPTRLRLVALLRLEGAMTATQAGERIGESAASCSFHFRQLAKWKLVEEAGGGRGRERPWRATARSTRWTIKSPELAEPGVALESLILREQADWMLQAMAALPAERPEWQAAHQLSDRTIRLSPSRLEELGRRVWEIVQSYEDEDDGPLTRRVSVLFAALPHPEAE